jgi:hypothetical protein
MRGEKLENHIILQFDKSICLAWRYCQLPLTSKRNVKAGAADVVEKTQRNADVRQICDDQQRDLVDAKGVPSDSFNGGREYGEPRSTSRIVSRDCSHHRIGPFTLGTNDKVRPVMYRYESDFP